MRYAMLWDENCRTMGIGEIIMGADAASKHEGEWLRKCWPETGLQDCQKP